MIFGEKISFIIEVFALNLKSLEEDEEKNNNIELEEEKDKNLEEDDKEKDKNKEKYSNLDKQLFINNGGEDDINFD